MATYNVRGEYQFRRGKTSFRGVLILDSRTNVIGGKLANEQGGLEEEIEGRFTNSEVGPLLSFFRFIKGQNESNIAFVLGPDSDVGETYEGNYLGEWFMFRSKYARASINDPSSSKETWRSLSRQLQNESRKKRIVRLELTRA